MSAENLEVDRAAEEPNQEAAGEPIATKEQTPQLVEGSAPAENAADDKPKAEMPAEKRASGKSQLSVKKTRTSSTKKAAKEKPEKKKAAAAKPTKDSKPTKKADEKAAKEEKPAITSDEPATKSPDAAETVGEAEEPAEGEPEEGEPADGEPADGEPLEDEPAEGENADSKILKGAPSSKTIKSVKSSKALKVKKSGKKEEKPAAGKKPTKPAKGKHEARASKTYRGLVTTPDPVGPIVDPKAQEVSESESMPESETASMEDVGHFLGAEDPQENLASEVLAEENAELDDISDMSISSEEHLEDAASYILQKPLEEDEMANFFVDLGDMPSLTSLEPDPSTEAMSFIRTSRFSADVYAEKDIGKFVDPLTGQVIQDEEVIEEEKPVEKPVEPVKTEEEDEEIDDPSPVIVEDDDELLMHVERDEDNKIIIPPFEETMDLWLEMESKKVVEIDETFDYEAYQREQEAKQMEISTRAFIDYLIKAAIVQAETVDPDDILRMKIDKHLVMMELLAKREHLKVELRAQQFLTRQAVGYYKRRKDKRYIVEEADEDVDAWREKHEEVKQVFDQLLGRLDRTSSASVDWIAKLKVAVVEEKQILQNNEQELTELLTKTLCLDGYQRLPQILNEYLVKMRKYREELSEVRIKLVQQSHNMARMIAKAKEIDHLGDDLTMTDFEKLQTQTQVLGKKLEEKINEINTLRKRCNSNYHQTAHSHETLTNMMYSINLQKQFIKDLTIKKQQVRNEMLEHKRVQSKLREELEKVSMEGGLISSNALMLDFDKLQEEVKLKRKRLNELRHQGAELALTMQDYQEREIEHRSKSLVSSASHISDHSWK